MQAVHKRCKLGSAEKWGQHKHHMEAHLLFSPILVKADEEVAPARHALHSG